VTNRDLIASVKNLASLASFQRSLVSVLYLVERKCFSELRTLRSQSGEHLDVLSPATADATAVVCYASNAAVYSTTDF
jgi:hypothetical protein